jgi:hypothetical protein
MRSRRMNFRICAAQIGQARSYNYRLHNVSGEGRDETHFQIMSRILGGLHFSNRVDVIRKEMMLILELNESSLCITDRSSTPIKFISKYMVATLYDLITIRASLFTE